MTGRNTGSERFYFIRRIFAELHLYDLDSALSKAGAFEFSTITGFAISFKAGSMKLEYGATEINSVTSGEPYKGLSITPSDHPKFTMIAEDIVPVNSLTIWYSC